MFAFQDLSAARYSGHVEQFETVTESRSYSSQTSGAPRPPERSVKSSMLGQKFSLTSSDHHDVHAAERSRNEEARDSRGLSSERGPESKWEYMGYGIWENRDPEEDGYEESPPPSRGWSAERNVHSMTNGVNGVPSMTNGVNGVHSMTNGVNGVHSVQTSIQKTFHNRSYSNNMENDNGGSASTATAGRFVYCVKG